MTRLTRSYVAVLLLLSLGLFLVLADTLIASRPGEVSGAVAFSALPGHALAVPYFEARWRVLGDDSGALFPGMRPLSTMDFVYAP